MSNQVKQLTLSAFFLALGLVLPFAFHSFGPQAGTVFLPMHIPRKHAQQTVKEYSAGHRNGCVSKAAYFLCYRRI